MPAPLIQAPLEGFMRSRCPKQTGDLRVISAWSSDSLHMTPRARGLLKRLVEGWLLSIRSELRTQPTDAERALAVAAELCGEKLSRFVTSAPSAQNAVDIFSGEWSSKLPDELNVHSGPFLLFDDPRLHWALGAIGGVRGKEVLELGPLEAGHTYMLEAAGVKHVTAIEANVRAFLKCLIVKELTKLQAADFLCGNFVEFLEQNNRTYDVALACGVLYHMTEPLRFLELLGKTADALVIFTHYYDEELIRRNQRVAGFFQGAAQARAGGFSCTVYRQTYPGEARSCVAFSGGTQPFSYWMQKADIIAALEHFGFRRIETSHDEPEHQNGPGFSLIACRS